MNEKKNLTTEETFSLAIKNHKKKNFKIAENLYIKTLKFDPNFVNAHYNLGIVLQELGEYKRAIKSYEKTIQIDPKFTDAHNNLGIVFDLLGKTTKAKNFYKKAIEIQPNYMNAYWNLHSLSSNIDEAIGILEKSLRFKKMEVFRHWSKFKKKNVFNIDIKLSKIESFFQDRSQIS